MRPLLFASVMLAATSAVAACSQETEVESQQENILDHDLQAHMSDFEWSYKEVARNEEKRVCLSGRQGRVIQIPLKDEGDEPACVYGTRLDVSYLEGDGRVFIAAAQHLGATGDVTFPKNVESSGALPWNWVETQRELAQLTHTRIHVPDSSTAYPGDCPGTLEQLTASRMSATYLIVLDPEENGRTCVRVRASAADCSIPEKTLGFPAETESFCEDLVSDTGLEQSVEHQCIEARFDCK